MTSARQPLVSVVVAVRDGADFVAGAIEAVRGQTYPAVELIVVDDGSTDRTAEAVQRAAPDRFVRLPTNCGVSTARNIGTALAAGELIAYLDADDVWLPDKLELQVARLEADPPCDYVLMHQRLSIDPDIVLPRWLETVPEDVDTPTKLPISVMIRMRSLLLAGGFDPTFRMSEEMDLLMRLGRTGARQAELAEVGVIRRIHGRNATYQHRLMEHDLIRAMAQLIRRRVGPAVSVIVPVHNGARYLAEALISARSQIGVDPADVEVIVVDDGSSDGSAALAEQVDPAATVVRQPRLGPGAARNHGTLLSRGRTLAFLDADDVWPADRLVSMLELSSSGTEAVFGSAAEFVSPDLPIEARDRLRPRPPVHCRLATAALIRRDAFARVGLFATDWTQPEAAVWYAAAVDAGISMGEVPRVVLRRRLHQTNHSRREAMATTSYPAALKEIIDRRRRETT